MRDGLIGSEAANGEPLLKNAEFQIVRQFTKGYYTEPDLRERGAAITRPLFTGAQKAARSYCMLPPMGT
jgi:hypothetical protein